MTPKRRQTRGVPSETRERIFRRNRLLRRVYGFGSFPDGLYADVRIAFTDRLRSMAPLCVEEVIHRIISVTRHKAREAEAKRREALRKRTAKRRHAQSR